MVGGGVDTCVQKLYVQTSKLTFMVEAFRSMDNLYD